MGQITLEIPDGFYTLDCERRPKSAAPAGLKVWRSGASYTGSNVGPVRELLA